MRRPSLRWREFNLQRRSLMPGGLFWRTFMLIGLLMALSLTSFVLALRALEVGPRAEQFALHLASIVNTTRAAIQHSAPEFRRALLMDLAQNEAIRVYALEPDDVISPLPDNALNNALVESLHRHLGTETLIGGEVNGITGFWVSFDLDEDRYWVAIARDRFERLPGVEWVFWGTAAVLLSLIGAAMIVALVNQPLARLGRAALQLSRGQAPPRLPLSNLREIRLVNDAFNRMVEDLQRIEADRALILAGISHDLRTPLARLALEVELSPASEDTKAAMGSDIMQMDKIVAQFLDYARPRSAEAETVVDLSSIVRAQADAVERQGAIVTRNIGDNLRVRGHETELVRAVTNLVENARKYGHKVEGQASEIDVWLRRNGGLVVFEVLDKGPGVPAADLERVKRPFTRVNEARSQASGAGLGLAIVERVVTRSGGKFTIANRPKGGLVVSLQLPAA